MMMMKMMMIDDDDDDNDDDDYDYDGCRRWNLMTSFLSRYGSHIKFISTLYSLYYLLVT